ncbi:M3 family metallopeptidase [Methanogenium cariaci]|uniref:M3 family metallopeptidase n=1 Tax=Methanogenium cariaci TaxID=2197 RepID=UPI001FE05030|nr:M3 family metallopeptidase [Methanogenium cariaci]
MEPEVLASISGHYTDTSEKIPPELLERVIAARDVGTGALYSRLLVNSLEDMRFHTATTPVDVTEMWYRTHEEVMGTRPLAGTHQRIVRSSDGRIRCRVLRLSLVEGLRPLYRERVQRDGYDEPDARHEIPGGDFIKGQYGGRHGAFGTVPRERAGDGGAV